MLSSNFTIVVVSKHNMLATIPKCIVLPCCPMFTHLILRHCNTSVVNPPQNSTVTMTITSVVVKMSCLSLDWVFLIASANAIAPLKPEKKRQQVKPKINIHYQSNLQTQACAGNGIQFFLYGRDLRRMTVCKHSWPFQQRLQQMI